MPVRSRLAALLRRAAWLPVTAVAIAACGHGNSATDMAVDMAGADVAVPRDLATSATDAPGAPDLAPCKTLDKNLTWHGANRDKLAAFIQKTGACGGAFDPKRPPVAVFDWDNTVVKNDVGDAMTYWMIKNSKILQPANKNWLLVSPLLTPDAVAALKGACDAAAMAGQPLPTGTNTACANEIFALYDGGKTAAGKTGFAAFNYRRTEPSYAFAAQLLAGYTAAELKNFVAMAATENLNAAIGATQTVGTNASVTGWIRIYDQQKDLISTLQANGFDVWIVSASPQIVVEVWAEKVGVEAKKVIGIRSLLDQGQKVTANFEGCGDVPDGSNDGMGGVKGNSMITYIEGKRCWINKRIFGDATAAAINKQADPAKRHVFAAGDSDTDVTFLQDATGLALVFNRNKKELMCNGYWDVNKKGKWLVNPMFIQPKAQQMAAYPCASTACKNDKGVGGPCNDEEGKPIPDQLDTVY